MASTGLSPQTLTPNPVPTPLDCLKVLVHYLKKEEKEKILRLLFEGTPPLIKFKKYNFRCRTIISERENLKISFTGTFNIIQNSGGYSVFGEEELIAS